jgi:ribosomal protein S18 acetylase RimI-like enzyme
MLSRFAGQIGRDELLLSRSSLVCWGVPRSGACRFHGPGARCEKLENRLLNSMHGPDSHASAWQLASRTVAQCTSSEVTTAIVRCFEGYLVPMRLTPERWEARSRAENLDPTASKVYYSEEAPAAVAMIARRGWTSRLAAMAVAPDFRTRGVGKYVMKIALEEAVLRKDHAMILEVFEQNPAAVSLYTGLGFRPMRRLVGYDFNPQGPGLPPSDSERLQEIDPLIVARLVAKEGEPDLPWMLMPETLAAATLPAQALHLQEIAFAIIADPDAEKIVVRALLVRKAHRRLGWGSRMLTALEARFADRPLSIQALVPENMAPGLFRRPGWERQKLNQFEMKIEF